MHWITEENYAQQMHEIVEPFIEERTKAGYFERIKGEPIFYRHYRADDPKGVIVISHGFTESIRKFTESVYYMLQAGYEVWGLDHRGHGRSFRQNKNPYVVHVERFEDYVRDLVYFTQTTVKPAAGELPVYLYCHSMGGCIGAWAIETWPDVFDKAVLSSPMMGLSFGKIPIPVVYAAASLKGIGEKRKLPMNPVDSFPQEGDFDHSCDSSKCRYDYYFAKRLGDSYLQTQDPSINWGKHAVQACARVTASWQTSKIKIPVLLFQAGNDTVVKNSAQDLFVSRTKNCEFVKIPGVKHELYMTDSEVLIPYWEKIFSFLG